jgi:NADH-quinone oxidoreductase subunit D
MSSADAKTAIQAPASRGAWSASGTGQDSIERSRLDVGQEDVRRRFTAGDAALGLLGHLELQLRPSEDEPAEALHIARFLDEFENLLSSNEIVMARTQRVGALSKELAINSSITGPMLRASGVDYDLRKVDKYGIYERFDFRVPLGDHGDCYDRYMIRVLEMRESLKILNQAIKDIPAGPIMDPKSKLRAFKPKAGEAYGRIEAPKGELGFYLISDGSASPYRYHVRPPSLINLTILEDMCLGQSVADAVVILGSVDIVLGEVDR